MVVGVDQQMGTMSYEEYVTLRQMDPGRAELEKSRRMQEYQKKRVSDMINEAKNEYKENLEEDPDRQTIYLRNFRERIVAIPMIQEFEEFKPIYDQVRKELDGLEVLEDQLNLMQNGDMPFDMSQPGQDELSSDEPDTQTVEDPDVVQARMEAENAQAISDRTETPEEATTEETDTPDVEAQPGQDELSSDEPDGETIEEVQRKYEVATGKPAPARYKNDIDRMKSKM